MLGDTVLQTPAIRELKKQGKHITYYCGDEHKSHYMLENNPNIDELIVLPKEELPTDGIYLDAWRAFEFGRATGRTIAEGFGSLCHVDVRDIRYDYTVLDYEIEAAKEKLPASPKGIVLVARHSASCSSNDPNVRVANKCVPNSIWVDVAYRLVADGYYPIAIGSKKDEEDNRYDEWIGDKLYGLPLRTIAAMTKLVCATLTVDTGIRHIAAATGGNMYCISGAIPLELIRCEPTQPEQKIFEEYRPLKFVNAKSIINGAKKVLC